MGPWPSDLFWPNDVPWSTDLAGKCGKRKRPRVIKEHDDLRPADHAANASS